MVYYRKLKENDSAEINTPQYLKSLEDAPEPISGKYIIPE
jgi:hypothetical protein